MDPAAPPKLQLPPRGPSRHDLQGATFVLSSSAPGRATFLFSEEDGQESPQARSPVPMPGVGGALDEDEGVFLLDDEDEEEEEIPEESCGAMDFGLTMEEYEPDEYVPSAPRVTAATPVSSYLSNLPGPRRMSDEEFLGSNFTGSPRLQSALQQLHSQCRSRAATGSSEDRFGAAPLGTSPPKA